MLEVPLIADADTGYGSPINVVRTVREYERAGVAAIQLEDQTFPKRCGHLAGKEVVAASRSSRGRSRSSRRAPRSRHRDHRAHRRARAARPRRGDLHERNATRELGADVIFVEAPRSVEEIEQIAAAGQGTAAAQPRARRADARSRPRPLASLGYRIAIYPGAVMMAVVPAAIESLQRLRGRGADGALDGSPRCPARRRSSTCSGSAPGTSSAAVRR